MRSVRFPRYARSPGLPRSFSQRALGTGLIVFSLAATLLALLIPVHLFGGAAPAAADARTTWSDDGRGTTATPSGPLTPLDRDFVRRVRLAGLWEKPAGGLAQERGTKDAVRMAGDHLVDGHTELDRRSIEVARALDVALPERPDADQRGWLDQLRAARGSTFERLFANLVRAAHGKVFALVALVRDRTGNAMVRALATRANTVVLDHITVLENTGLVDFPHPGNDEKK
ncbi:DUF4142 domain-containing protein [Streptomyces albireticuli]|uniref:DUF4142 domain-containing protein n=1 Tax=Streptomyces albireticuli TaxID=1940 RepID=A0A2A2D1Y9_9ACTN|nr:DUF4142 domain-containing protein [Streptomyces albireticuli]MCD9193465.1 DUF4142 domain-containing protein [Streptomyces albireticuli]PAU46443.1 hypothetical protein CK936_24160 [Streptomyces albireticuli]